DLLQAVVVLVELPRDGVDVVVDLGAPVPGKIRDPFQVVARHVSVGRVGVEGLQAPQLAVDRRPHLLGEAGPAQALAQLAELVVLVALAELALNRAELLTKHRFSLIAAELPPNLLTELLLELPASLGLGDELRAQMEPRRDVQSEEDLDLSLRIDVE